MAQGKRQIAWKVPRQAQRAAGQDAVNAHGEEHRIHSGGETGRTNDEGMERQVTDGVRYLGAAPRQGCGDRQGTKS